MDHKQVLQFAPFNSALDAGFWHQLSELKLNVYGLDDQTREITGFYMNGDADGLPCRVNLDHSAFDESIAVPPRSYTTHGVLKNTNTFDNFKTCDKKVLMDQQAQQLWKDITNGNAIQDISLLSRFLLLAFADLKKYHYYYWFAFPALCAPETTELTHPPTPIEEAFSGDQIISFLESFDSVCLPQHIGFFAVVEDSEKLNVVQLRDLNTYRGKQIYLGFCDPCTLAAYPGWPLRNLLALASYHWAEQFGGKVKVICLRDRFKDGKRSISHSIIVDVALSSTSQLTDCPKCVGWEKNERQKLGPRSVNLSSSMDPTKLAESAVDLNLKLMRWRLLPELDLEAISATRCLLLGAGTLGCNVARLLLAWGIRNITLVDNGRISYSNPVRQTLFVFEDSLHGGQPKAQAAAEGLKKIFPGVNANGISLSIPMPGHTVTDASMEQTSKDVAQLDSLIDSHDVVFLLMDTRESRWLPTVIGGSKQKIVINAALGFDTYLVVRHGVKLPPSCEAMQGTETHNLSATIPGHQLGCYFCNDVVAPGDSTRDRTLDQQCTVSRPGLSMIASALAVEILISVLTHPLRGHAPGDSSAKDDHLSKDFVSPLGLVPHQIRGFLSRFYNVMPASLAFDKCTACSPVVLESYHKEGFKFLLNVFNQPKYLEDLTGLTKLHAETLDDQVWEFSEEEDM